MSNFLIQPLHRFLRVFVVGAVLTLCATVAQTQDVKGRVSVGLYKSPPFVMTAEDGALTGMAVDLWERLAEALKLETEMGGNLARLRHRRSGLRHLIGDQRDDDIGDHRGD